MPKGIKRAWTQAEKDQVMRGENPPGRPLASCYQYRRTLRKKFGLAKVPIVPSWGPFYTSHEDALIIAGHNNLPGRSRVSCNSRRQYLRERLGNEAVPHAPYIRGLYASIIVPTGILATASRATPGYEILQRVHRALPSGLMQQVREEAIGAAMLRVLDHGEDPETAAKAALRETWRFLGLMRRDVPLHDAYWL